MTAGHQAQGGRTAAAHGSGFRPEIQGLRAIAVLAVLVFHLWPQALSGGYVGVDVFFVISGFLITGILLREAERTGRIDIPGFYAKRIKRLVPVATLVILAVAVCISLLPVTRWFDTANEIAASALYMQNWWLAGQAVDYLAAENAPGPLQHYWTLSVEEQYYIAWPLLFALTAPLALRAGMSPRRRFALVVVAVGLLSLACSVYLTPRSPGTAYFATTTRAWELAIGGALAVFRSWERLPLAARTASGWIGLAMVLAACVAFDAGTAFPGYAALLPTVGAALMIMAGTGRHAASVSMLLNLRPMQYIGDLSYSLYLWHWPVIIFYRYVAGRDLGLVDGVVVAAVSLALAHQSKVLVEDVFRRPGFAAGARWKPFAVAALCIGMALACWQSIRWQLDRLEAAAPAAAAAAAVGPGDAASSAGGCSHDLAACLAGVRPALAAVAKDIPPAYREQGCHSGLDDDDVRLCELGSAAAGTTLFVIGDSHAAQWFPVYEYLASEHGLGVRMTTKSACSFADVMVKGGRSGNGAYRSCAEWGGQALGAIASERPDYVLMAQSNAYSLVDKDRAGSFEDLVEGYLRRMDQVQRQAGSKLLVLADTPRMGINAPDCLSRQGATFAGCSRPLAPRPDPLVEAARRAGVPVVDANDLVCPDGTCPPIVGDVLVWRDSHHITATFAGELSPVVSRRIVEAME